MFKVNHFCFRDKNIKKNLIPWIRCHLLFAKQRCNWMHQTFGLIATAHSQIAFEYCSHCYSACLSLKVMLHNTISIAQLCCWKANNSKYSGKKTFQLFFLFQSDLELILDWFQRSTFPCVWNNFITEISVRELLLWISPRNRNGCEAKSRLFALLFCVSKLGRWCYTTRFLTQQRWVEKLITRNKLPKKK